jgi:S-formylglutathione hydrolase FrmB
VTFVPREGSLRWTRHDGGVICTESQPRFSGGQCGGWLMSLLGLPMVIGAIVLAVAVTIACVWVSGRLRGPAISQTMKRTLMVLACQVSAVLAVAVVVNQQYEFYATWDDLVGTGDGGGAVTPLTPPDHAVGPGGHTGARLRFSPFGQDGVQVATYAGPRTGIRSKVYIWLPPQYNQAAYAGKRFPVIELLPGFPGPVHNWFTMLDVTRRLRQEMAGGTSQPAILVAPTMQVRPGLDTDCTDVPGLRMETWAAEDVRTMVMTNFRARTDGSGWAAMGYSEGGFCATKLAVQHPRNYRAAVSLSGYFTPTAAIITRSPALFRSNDLMQVLRRHRPSVSLLVMGTRQDTNTALDVMRLRKVAHAPTRVFSSILPMGGHNYGVWSSMLPQAIQWISRQWSRPR